MKVLIMEDEKSIANLIGYDLKMAKMEYSIALNGKDGLQQADQDKYDVYIIDWMMPEVNGIDAVKELRRKNKDGVIIMLTAKDEEENILEAFEAGVDDYITKPFSPRILLARILAHTKRKSFNNEESYSMNDLSLDLHRREAKVKEVVIDLTKKEFDLLEYFFRNKRIVLSREKILNEIWNFDYDGDTRIVDVHVFKLRNKISNSRVTIKSSRGIGYQLEEEL